MYIPKEQRTLKNELYQRLKRVHYGMMRRCYTEKDYGYANYGAKGCTVWEGWHNFEDFLATIDTVEGWDADTYVSNKLALDKDKVWGNKLYSPSTCRFITPEDNNKRKPNQQYKIVGMSPEGQLFKFTSANGFAKDHGLNYNGILKCVHNEARQYLGWQFCKASEYSEDRFVEPYSWEREIVGMSPDGVLHTFTNASAFAREHGLIGATVIYACANGKNKHSYMWQFRYKDEIEEIPFTPTSELVPASRRDVLVEATDPNGVTYEFYNKTKFAKEHGLPRAQITKVIQGKSTHYKGWKFRNI